MPFKIVQTTLLAFRILLATLGAFALLYAFSYPNNIIPPSPNWDCVDELSNDHIANGIQAVLATCAAPLTLLFPWVRIPVADGPTPDSFAPWLWLGPWLLMEVTSCLGTKRNFVWFTSLSIVLLTALVAWPVLTATHPEYVHPTMAGDDGKLADGMIKFGVFLFFSIFLRKIVLDFLFNEKKGVVEDDINYADADVLDPAKARTVREIAADTVKVAPKFLFGEADSGLIAKFRALMSKLTRRRAAAALSVLAGVALLVAWVLFLYPQPTEQEALARDLDNMYGQSPLRDKQGNILSSPEAVHAAYRVFTHLAEQQVSPFVGKDDDALDKWLQVHKADPAFLRQARSGSVVPNPKDIYMMDADDRYLTFSDGMHAVTLIVRHADGLISNVEMQYAGWNPNEDYKSWRKWSKMRARQRITE